MGLIINIPTNGISMSLNMLNQSNIGLGPIYIDPKFSMCLTLRSHHPKWAEIQGVVTADWIESPYQNDRFKWMFPLLVIGYKKNTGMLIVVILWINCKPTLFSLCAMWSIRAILQKMWNNLSIIKIFAYFLNIIFKLFPIYMNYILG